MQNGNRHSERYFAKSYESRSAFSVYFTIHNMQNYETMLFHPPAWAGQASNRSQLEWEAVALVWSGNCPGLRAITVALVIVVHDLRIRYRVWSLKTGELVNTLQHHCEAVLHLRFADGVMVTCSKVCFISLISGSCIVLAVLAVTTTDRCAQWNLITVIKSCVENSHEYWHVQ